MSLVAVAPVLDSEELLVPLSKDGQKSVIESKKNWKKILARSLLLGLIVGLIMAGISVISSYIAVGSPPHWRSIAAASFSSFALTVILTFVLNYM